MFDTSFILKNCFVQFLSVHLLILQILKLNLTFAFCRNAPISVNPVGGGGGVGSEGKGRGFDA